MMIKSELITKLANLQNQKELHISEKDIASSINLIIDCLSDHLGSGQRIEIRGFGSFNLHYRAPRNAHNPKTGAKLVTQGKYSPHFKPGKKLRIDVDASKNQYPIIGDEELD